MANSDQEIETPNIFIDAVKKYFDIPYFELDVCAKDESVAKGIDFLPPEIDGLKLVWSKYVVGYCWCNPPFNQLDKWVKKCYEEMNLGAKIIQIMPLSGDANRRLSWQYSSVYVIEGRVWPEVRGCSLHVWDKSKKTTIEGLKWDKKNGTLTRIW